MPQASPALDAERALLGALLSGAPAAELLALARPQDFSTAQHMAIAESIAAVAATGAEPDQLLVTQHLRAAGTLLRSGGPTYLSDLAADCATTVNAEWYALQVHDRAARGHFAAELRLAARAAETDDAEVGPDDLVARAYDAAALLTHGGRLDVVAPRVGTTLDASLGLFGRRFAGEERPIPLPWPRASAVLGGGLWPGSHVLTGGTAAGKTALALQVVLSALQFQHPVLYVGLELDTAQIHARLLSLLLADDDGRPRAHWSSIYTGKVDPATLGTASATLRTWPLYVEEAPPGGWSCLGLRPRVEQLARKHPGKAPLVVVDFLQLVGPTTTRREELRERIGAAAYQGREVARRTGAVVLLLSSISRGGAGELGRASSAGTLGTGDPADLVGLGKESADIEFSADTVLSLAGEQRHPGEDQRIWLACAKVRAGAPAWSLLKFNGSWFTEAGEHEAQEHVTGRRSAKEQAQATRHAQATAEAEALVVRYLKRIPAPVSVRALRAAIPRRAAVVDAALEAAAAHGAVRHDGKGWVYVPPCPACPDVSGTHVAGGVSRVPFRGDTDTATGHGHRDQPDTDTPSKQD